MFWVSAIIWATVLIAYICSKNSHFKRATTEWESTDSYAAAKKINEYALFCISLTHWGISLMKYDQSIADEILGDLKKRADKRSDKRLFCICHVIILIYKKFPKLTFSSFYILSLLCYFWRETLSSFFVLSSFIAIQSIFYVSDWLEFLPIEHRVLFWGIPIVLFSIPVILYKCFQKKDLPYSEDFWIRLVLKSFIYAFWISFVLSFFIYDWQTAKSKREEYLIETFGEDYEEILKEMRE